jgi:trans-aconitate 2-methyltransferase
MTEWDANEYSRRSGLQEAMAEEILALLDLEGSERVLDVGCGDGKITAEIATRVPQGTVVGGVDASQDADQLRFKPLRSAVRPNLRFRSGRSPAPFRNEFNLVVSFNALHWVPEQDAALRSIGSAMMADGRVQLASYRPVSARVSENVVEETRLSSRWNAYFPKFRDPYLHLTPEQYGEMAERNGLRVLHIRAQSKNVGLQVPVGIF